MGLRISRQWNRLVRSTALAACCAGLPGSTFAQGTPTPAGAAVLLEARHLGSLVRFYESELGLPVLARDAATGRAVFDAGGTQLVIVPRRPMDEPQNVTARLLLPCAALDSAQVRLTHLQVPFRTMYRLDATPWALFFQDPEGNPLGYCTLASDPAAWPTSLQGSGASELRGESGVVEFMVYCGIYGAWLSAAIPIGLGVDDAATVGACVLLTSPIAVLAAYQYGKHTRLSRGQARTISILGNWATWQGIGWALPGDFETEDVVVAGAVAGAATIVGTAALVRGHDISTGQATVLHAATYWGAWYGIVGAGMAAGDQDEFIYSTLIASTVGLVGGGAWGLGHDISASRARLISLGGLLGTLMGWGIDLLVQPDGEAVLWGIPGATGFIGLGAGAWATRHREPAELSQSRWQLELPTLAAPRAGERFRCRVVGARF